ncbi:MAG: hypothetical protein ACXVA3_04780 [Vulcanimicrobiaceae bacterium]
MQTLIDHRAALHASALAGYVTAANAGVSQYLQHAGSVRTLSSLLAQQSQTLSLSDVMMLFAPIVIAIIPLIFLADLG